MSTAYSDLIFRQLFDQETCTYTYLLACKRTKQALLIDPVIEKARRDANLIKELSLDLIYTMNTHVHADHITGSGMLKKLIPKSKSLVTKNSGAQADILISHGQIIKLGDLEIEARCTPGHTNGCVTYVDHKHRMAFTGDALLIRGCGRTDFQEGSPQRLYNSVHSQIFSLQDDFLLYPGHDYKGQTVTSVAEEKKHNPRLTKPLEEFIKIMDTLGLDYPKKIDISLPANKVCGLYNLPDYLEEEIKNAKAL